MILSRTTRGSLHPICGVNSSNSGELLLFPRTSSPPHRYTIGEKFTRRGEQDGVRLLLQGPLRVSLTRVIFPAASPSLLPFFPLHSFSRPLPCCSFPLIWPSHFSFLCHLMSSAFAEWGRGFLFVYTKIRHEKKKKNILSWVCTMDGHACRANKRQHWMRLIAKAEWRRLPLNL